MSRKLKQNGEFAVVVCADINMAAAAVCVLNWAWIKSSIELNLYLVGVGFDKETREKIADFIDKKKVPIKVLEYSQKSYEGHELQRFGLAALTRLSLDKILPNLHKRVLYLDADIFVAGDLAQLFKIDMLDRPIGASFDISKKGNAFTIERRKTLNLSDTARYFTSAVLLFDWKISINKKVFEKAREAFWQSKNFKFPDQDAINVAVDGNYFNLPQKWHVEPYMWRIVPTFQILHFSGKFKPWNADAPWMLRLYKNEFYKAVSGTKFSNFCSQKSTFNIRYFALSIHYYLKMRKKERAVVSYYGVENIKNNTA